MPRYLIRGMLALGVMGAGAWWLHRYAEDDVYDEQREREEDRRGMAESRSERRGAHSEAATPPQSAVAVPMTGNGSGVGMVRNRVANESRPLNEAIASADEGGEIRGRAGTEAAPINHASGDPSGTIVEERVADERPPQRSGGMILWQAPSYLLRRRPEREKDMGDDATFPAASTSPNYRLAVWDAPGSDSNASIVPHLRRRVGPPSPTKVPAEAAGSISAWQS